MRKFILGLFSFFIGLLFVAYLLPQQTYAITMSKYFDAGSCAPLSKQDPCGLLGYFEDDCDEAFSGVCDVSPFCSNKTGDQCYNHSKWGFTSGCINTNTIYNSDGSPSGVSFPVCPGGGYRGFQFYSIATPTPRPPTPTFNPPTPTPTPICEMIDQDRSTYLGSLYNETCSDGGLYPESCDGLSSPGSTGRTRIIYRCESSGGASSCQQSSNVCPGTCIIRPNGRADCILPTPTPTRTPTPTPNPTCASLTSCNSCIARPGCGWLGGAEDICVNGNACPVFPGDEWYWFDCSTPEPFCSTPPPPTPTPTRTPTIAPTPGACFMIAGSPPRAYDPPGPCTCSLIQSSGVGFDQASCESRNPPGIFWDGPFDNGTCYWTTRNPSCPIPTPTSAGPTPTRTPTPTPTAVPIVPWFQSVGSDIRWDNGIYNHRIPSGQYASIAPSGGMPGVIFSGSNSTSPSFTPGGSNPNNWVVRGDTYASTHNLIPTSYNFLNDTALAKGQTINNINPPVLNSGDPLASGVHRKNGNLRITGNRTFGSGNYIILVNGDLEIENSASITVTNGSTVIFSVSGNILVRRNVTNIQGLYSAGRDFVVEGGPGAGGDSPLTIEGTVVVNANHSGGSFQNDRDLGAANATFPSVSFVERPDFLLNYPEITQQTTRSWQEVAP